MHFMKPDCVNRNIDRLLWTHEFDGAVYGPSVKYLEMTLGHLF